MENAMTAISHKASVKMHDGILFDHCLPWQGIRGKRKKRK